MGVELMATATGAVVTCPKSQWTLIADGANGLTVGLQVVGYQQLGFAVATSQPAVGSTAFEVLNDIIPARVITLTASDKVYGRGLAGDAYARFDQGA
jgi:hypothetical protein